MALSHADRGHLAGDAATRWPTDDLHWSPLLVDGFVAGAWRATSERRSATIVVRLLGPVPGPDRAAVEEEAARLLAFVAPDAEQRQVQVDGGPVTAATAR